LKAANEGLEYLDARKDFWQQQKPVYARKNELFASQKSTPKKFNFKKVPGYMMSPARRSVSSPTTAVAADGKL
jgi:hypothetical protein